MPARSHKLAGIVLAAGASSRLGQPKQLLQHGPTTLLGHAISLAEQSCDLGVKVVLGAGAAELRQTAAGDKAEVVLNTAWQTGMAGSLQAGLAAVPAEAAAVLLLLCDQPMLEPEDIEALIEVWQNQPAWPAAAAYNGVIGAPAVIPAEFLPELAASLSGDSGAGKWLRGRADVTCIDTPNAALDIDTPADLGRLITKE